MPAEVVLAALRDDTDVLDRLRRFLPKDYAVRDGEAPGANAVLQSHFNFAVSVSTQEGAQVRNIDAARELFGAFLEGELYDVLTEDDELLKESGIKMYYSSEELDRTDLFHELWSDIRLAVGSIVLIFVTVRASTRSFLLATAGLFLILESIPLGFVLFQQFTKLEEVSIVNCLSVFVIVGIGSDLVFVLNDGWNQSRNAIAAVDSSGDLNEDKRHEANMRARLLWLWGNAGASCTVTTLCSVASFLVNLGSVLMPLREFGLFMGLCVLCSLLLLLAMYPLACVKLEGRGQVSAAPPAEPASLAVVPHCTAEVGSGSSPPSTGPLADPTQVQRGSKTARFFFGSYTSCLAVTKCGVLCQFALIALVSLIGLPLMISVDGDMPVIFPDSHNQVEGKRLKEMYEPVYEVAASSGNHDAWVCELTASPLPEDTCKDNNEKCGNSVTAGYCASESSKLIMEALCAKSCGHCSYCLYRNCQVEEEPVQRLDSPGQCTCYQEDSEADAAAGYGETQVNFQTTIVGFSLEDWPSLQPHVHAYLRSLMGAPELTEVSSPAASTSAARGSRRWCRSTGAAVASRSGRPST